MSENCLNGEKLEQLGWGRQEAARRLSQTRSLVVVSHDRPDGDSLGSMVALAESARGAGKRAEIVCQDAVPEKYAYLFEQSRPLGMESWPAQLDEAELVVVVDTCAWGQMEPLAEGLRGAKEKTIVVDHHKTGQDVGSVRWVDEGAAATAVMVVELLERLGWPFGYEVARAAMTGICADTGWLRFSNTDGRALKAAAKCVEAGARPDELYRALFESDRAERIALVARALSKLQLHCGGRLAVMVIEQKDFAETGARPDETENLINEAMRIGQVEAAALLTETAEGGMRVSLRSKSKVDVAALAQQFDGGGHVRAAGFRSDASAGAIAEKIIYAVTGQLDG